MKCVAVDDEPMALELIESYILKTSNLDLVDSFTNPFKALNFLLENKVDLIFLDIEMPELTGIQLLKSLPYKPKVIFTTAYSEYGAESYEHNAVDYLLKPFKYDRFMRAINKIAKTTTQEYNKPSVENVNKKQDVLFLKSGTKIHKVIVKDITFIEAQGNYITVFTIDSKVMTLLSMNDILNQLDQSEFVRIHKSYIVAIKHIDIIEKHQVIVNNKNIPIGVTYREYFHKLVDELRS